MNNLLDEMIKLEEQLSGSDAPDRLRHNKFYGKHPDKFDADKNKMQDDLLDKLVKGVKDMAPGSDQDAYLKKVFNTWPDSFSELGELTSRMGQYIYSEGAGIPKGDMFPWRQADTDHLNRVFGEDIIIPDGY